MITIKKYFTITPFIMFVLACGLHFLYDFTGELPLIGLISPINESIFEHTKLIFIPLLIIYSFYYFRNKEKLDTNRYFFSMLISIILGILLVPMIFYFYTEGFGVESMIFDILITLISLGLSNLLFYNYYNLHNFTFNSKVSITLLTLIYLFYIYATFNIINMPIFIPN